MMATSESFNDKNAVFRKLRAKSENKIVWSTNLDSWTPEQLKIMTFGGNNRAQVFFKQHGWSDGGKIDAKYTSRAAELYRQLLAKEVAKSTTEEAGLPSSPVAHQSAQASNGLPDVNIIETPTQISSAKQEFSDVSASPKASHTAFTSSMKKPIGTKKTGKTGGLGARKLTTKPKENLYDQKPEEPPLQVSTSTNSAPTSGSSFASRFEYVDSFQAAPINTGDTHAISHVAPPKSSSFFADFGMDSGFSKKTSSSSSKIQVEETDEARKKFSNAKSISSAQYFGDQNNAATDAQASLQKFSVFILLSRMPLAKTCRVNLGSTAISSADLFGSSADDSSLDVAATDLINRLSFQAQQDISSLQKIAGDTGKKLSSLASNFLTDFQDRIL
ncbi:hypothetical protein RHGRI_030753 [Rhododendron griersonianum]|uniref:Arf-GAP domain-containing protein n=1 Tax=Rhododendron griersonianum TaxID=479676 RepID=A0AAV6I9V1_9ERIC|nr:hypothetical protein RHGRI_030753 [Rhododendron griersonianum]